MSVTIKDIAKIANVSHTTVSRALNGSPLIKEETKKRISKIAKQLNYTPNYNAKSLVLDKSYNIGLFFSTLDQRTTDYFFHEVVKEVNGVIKDQFNLIVKGIDDYKDYNRINKMNFDGIIVMSQSQSDNDFIYNIIEKEIPIVVLNREIKDSAVANILSADKKGAFMVGEYLINRGHEKIATIEGVQNFSSTRVRREGFMNALSMYNVTLNRELYMSGDYSYESGYKAMQKLLKLKEKPTAVFCFNDDMATGAIKAISENALKIPEDISIVGFDDNGYSAYMMPALTTVKRNIGKVGKIGAQKLLQIMDEKQVKEETLYVETDLIVRDSVGRLK